MARGDIIIFDKFLEDTGDGVHDLSNDTLRIGFVNNATVPSATTSDPRWGAGGGTNFATNQQSGGNYPATPDALSGKTWNLTGGQGVLDATDPAVYSANASNPTSLYWAIIYNDTAAGKQCVCAYDLGGPVDGTSSDLDLNFNAGGILTADQA